MVRKRKENKSYCKIVYNFLNALIDGKCRRKENPIAKMYTFYCIQFLLHLYGEVIRRQRRPKK